MQNREISDPRLGDYLRRVFGYDKFRSHQERVIQCLLNREDVFVIMPTGAGKSLCYQLPALLMEGTALVVSPLIALMKNQVDHLKSFDIEAHFLNSTLGKKGARHIRQRLLEGGVKLLYIAPESLAKPENIEILRQVQISFLAVDEAHCISEWGHDFRPEYRRIREFAENIGSVPIAALTATATPQVRLDIQKNLKIESAKLFVSSFNRENLFYQIVPKQRPEKLVLNTINKHKGESGIIYCMTRKRVEKMAETLKQNKIKAVPYHAGLAAKDRVRYQEDFLSKRVDVVVATIAFGMGIDKPDVRYVIHYDAPKSLESYYQETGRAGRDGKPSDCLLLFCEADIFRIEKLNKDKAVSEQDNLHWLCKRVCDYAENASCRRKHLLHYFGEHFEAPCGYCDNCKRPPSSFEGKDMTVTLLRLLKDAKGRVPATPNGLFSSWSPAKLSLKDTYHVLVHLHMMGLIKRHAHPTEDSFSITEKGQKFLKNPSELSFPRAHIYTERESTPERKLHTRRENDTACDETLLAILKGLRDKVAKRRKLPPYVVFETPSLEEMSMLYPTDRQELLQIRGVGRGKAEKFGDEFLKAIREYVEENQVVRYAKPPTRPTQNGAFLRKSNVIKKIDRKIPLDEIAEDVDLTMEELTKELEEICRSGIRISIQYYLSKLLDEHEQQEIRTYFLESVVDDVDQAIKTLGETYSEEEIRLSRVHFLSELGN